MRVNRPVNTLSATLLSFVLALPLGATALPTYDAPPPAAQAGPKPAWLARVAELLQQALEEKLAWEAAEEEPADPVADLRVVGIAFDPDPLRDGGGATLTVMLHNDSTVAAAGGIGIEVVHDRPTPQPLPIRREILFLGPDGLAQVTFEVAGVELERTPYTFFAAVDTGGVVEEFSETDNTFWLRVDVCGALGLVEEPDGFDNDCNGMVDDGIGLPVDTAVAVNMLRQMQRQAELDRVPLIHGLAEVFAPLVEQSPVRISRRADAWLGNVADATPSFRAALEEEAPAARLFLLDWNGGELLSGDVISLRTQRGDFVVAEGGGGGLLVSRSEYREPERLFTIVKIIAETETADMTPDERLARRRDVESSRSASVIRSGDNVALVAATGRFVAAEEGGGRELRADRETVGGWETFTLVIEEPEQQ